MVTLESAQDDKGQSLELQEDGFSDPATEFVKIDRDGFFADMHPENGAKVGFTLKSGAEESTAIAELTGTMQLRSASATEEIIIDDIASMDGQEISDPTLTALGYGFKVEVGEDDFGSPTVTLELTETPPGEDRAALVDALMEGGAAGPQQPQLLDSNGDPIEDANYGYGGGGGSLEYSASVDDGIPAGAKLRIVVNTEVEVVDVSFDLSDIAIQEGF